MIEFLVIGWVAASVTSLAGIHALFKAEHARQLKIDLAVDRAWRVVERELNPPPPPDPEHMSRMAAMQQAVHSNSMANMQNAYNPFNLNSGLQTNAANQLLGLSGMLGNGLFGR